MTYRSQANFAEYEAIKLKVNNWYIEESRELFLKCKARDLDSSESSTIYHHQMHKKLFKHSSLLKVLFQLPLKSFNFPHFILN